MLEVKVGENQKTRSKGKKWLLKGREVLAEFTGPAMYWNERILFNFDSQAGSTIHSLQKDRPINIIDLHEDLSH